MQLTVSVYVPQISLIAVCFLTQDLEDVCIVLGNVSLVSFNLEQSHCYLFFIILTSLSYVLPDSPAGECKFRWVRSFGLLFITVFLALRMVLGT